MVISGVSPDRVLAEVVELDEHPWFLGCQFHPEFKSRPLDPHPLFSSYIKAVAEQKRVRGKSSKSAIVPMVVTEGVEAMGSVTPEA